VRNLLLLAVALAVVASAPVGAIPATDQAPADAEATGAGPNRATAAAAPIDAASTAAVEREDPVIVERITVDRTPNRSGSVRVDVAYDLPSNVVEFSADTEYLGLDTVTLSASPGFDQQRDDSFEWDGSTERPTLSFRIDTPSRFGGSEFNVAADDWAFVSPPDVYVSWRYRGSAPTFRTVSATANGGVASSASAIDGTANASSRTIQGVNFTLVSSPDTTPGASTDEYASLYAVGLRELVGTDHEALTTFVVSADGVDTESLAAGAAHGDSFWVQGQYSGIDYLGNTPAHEFVHTRMGSFGDGSSRWLTEASAEYYGYVLTVNTDRGTWSEFREALRVRDTEYREATLAEPSTWDDGSFQRTPYRKGALVLAALDAEIANRTGGVRSLQDVFAHRDDDDRYGDLETYENFSAAVVAVTNDPSMRDWLDRYVAGSETPRVPSDPDAFVLNASMDSDDDGVPNGDEVRTNPFQSDTDRDGFDDGEDAYPTDDTRYEETTTTTRTTTTLPTTTSPSTTPPTLTTAASTTTTAATTTAVSTSEAASGSDGDDDGTAGDATESAGSTSVDRTTSAAAGGGGDSDGGDAQYPGDAVPGFGVAVATLALLASTVALRRRS